MNPALFYSSEIHFRAGEVGQTEVFDQLPNALTIIKQAESENMTRMNDSLAPAPGREFRLQPVARPAYPEYKDSGIEWLGPIPAHWEVQKLKHISSVTFSSVDKHTIEGEQSVRLCNYVDVYYNDQITDALEFMQATATPDEITKFSLQRGDVIVTKDSESWDDIAVAAYVPSKLEGVLCGYHLALICPKTRFMDGRYLFRSFNARGIDHQFKVAATGITRYGLGKYWLDNSFFPIPPLPEQRALADFLDRETAKIDTLVAKKQRMIELLGEQRAALISHAVTKGLNPEALMKDSGVEWLGEIPAHWEARQLKYVANISYGLTLELDRTETKGTYIISLPNVTKRGQLILDEVPLTPLTDQKKKHLLLQKGDLLFNWRNGSPDHIGKTAYFDADGEYIHVSFLLRLRFDPTRQESRYYQMFLNGLRSNGFFSAAKTRVNKTYNQTELSRLEVMVPPLEEQCAIAAYLDHETAKIDAIIAKTQETIEKLKEYRTALISAAVTGKIDVRETISTNGGNDGETS